MPLRNAELDTWPGCEELADRGPRAEQMAGKGWELPFCTGSGAAGDRAGRRLTLVALSSDDTWLGKVGIPEELSKEGDIRLSDSSSRARSGGGKSGPCALQPRPREFRICWSFSEMCSHRLGRVYTASSCGSELSSWPLPDSLP